MLVTSLPGSPEGTFSSLGFPKKRCDMLLVFMEIATSGGKKGNGGDPVPFETSYLHKRGGISQKKAVEIPMLESGQTETPSLIGDLVAFPIRGQRTEFGVIPHRKEPSWHAAQKTNE